MRAIGVAYHHVREVHLGRKRKGGGLDRVNMCVLSGY
jgi:hypothetical protein